MRATRRITPQPGPLSVDVAILAPRGRRLGVLCRPGADGAVELPWNAPPIGEALDDVARETVRVACGVSPAWIEQARTFGAEGAHPARGALSLCYAGLLGSDAGVGGLLWVDVRSTATLWERQRLMVRAAVDHVRTRVDHAPVAFRLLAPRFTLAELQVVYEVLLGRRLHKASFRRSLESSGLVEPTSAWRSEGRGRPARLYRYAPRRRGRRVRAVRFDLP